jgi:hypothetical protein
MGKGGAGGRGKGEGEGKREREREREGERERVRVGRTAFFPLPEGVELEELGHYAFFELSLLRPRGILYIFIYYHTYLFIGWEPGTLRLLRVIIAPPSRCYIYICMYMYYHTFYFTKYRS